ncbi:COP23 domain-containing protein [Kamptonema formosum]|uniref:COP23 domain-containing protein n=1 Tax=Kamptonema formosum TaxID=331992 RepID=UPI00034C96EC|nr:COP23 domain-containing protein [Oscillatoria sp. PCC 10802]
MWEPNGAGTPTTYAILQRYGRLVRVRAIVWFFREAEKTPCQRCWETSANFQEAYRLGILNCINAGTVYGQPVICTTSTLGGDCQIALFTLRYQQDAAQVLQRLRGVRKGAAGPLLESSADEPESGAVDMNLFLKTAPAEEVPYPTPQQAGATRGPDLPPSPPNSPPSNSDWLF